MLIVPKGHSFEGTFINPLTAKGRSNRLYLKSQKPPRAELISLQVLCDYAKPATGRSNLTMHCVQEAPRAD